jgi:hypothetical protein
MNNRIYLATTAATKWDFLNLTSALSRFLLFLALATFNCAIVRMGFLRGIVGPWRREEIKLCEINILSKAMKNSSPP